MSTTLPLASSPVSSAASSPVASPVSSAPSGPDSAGTCCSPLTGGVLDAAAAERLARSFKALGDPTRVRLLSLIAASPSGEACVCNLTDVVGLAQPTVSHHMRLLVDAGLVTRDQRGKWAYYAIAHDALDALAAAVGSTVGAAGAVAPAGDGPTRARDGGA